MTERGVTVSYETSMGDALPADLRTSTSGHAPGTDRTVAP